MSMKRAKRASSGSSKDSGGDSPFGFMKPETPATWAELTQDKNDGEFKPYSMSTTYAKGDLVTHPKFGKGAVVLVEGNRVEILFEEGAKKLGHAAA